MWRDDNYAICIPNLILIVHLNCWSDRWGQNPAFFWSCENYLSNFPHIDEQERMKRHFSERGKFAENAWESVPSLQGFEPTAQDGTSYTSRLIKLWSFAHSGLQFVDAFLYLSSSQWKDINIQYSVIYIVMIYFLFLWHQNVFLSDPSPIIVYPCH